VQKFVVLDDLVVVASSSLSAPMKDTIVTRNTVSCMVIYSVGSSPFIDCSTAIKDDDVTKTVKASRFMRASGRCLTTISETKKLQVTEKELLEYIKLCEDVEEEEKSSAKGTKQNKQMYRGEGMSALVTLDLLTSVGRATQSAEPICVYDPFMGVGTTGLVAMALGCCFIGLDSDEKCQRGLELLLMKARKKNADGSTSRWCTGGALYREEDPAATGDGENAAEVITK
jgi:hypothetical protein